MSGRAWLLAALLVAGSASAQRVDDRARIEEGRGHRRAGRNEEALRAFREAYALRPTPEAAGQIGFAEHALERWEPASRHLREALAEPRDAWVVAQREALEFSLRAVESHLGSLRVECATPDATVSIVGRADTALPMREPLRLPPGTVEIETRAPGHRAVRQEVTLAAGETVRVVVQLAPAREATAVTPVATPTVTPGSAPTARPDEAPRVAAPPVVSPGERVEPATVSRTMHHLAWVALGSAALLTGGAVAAMVVRDDAASRWNDDARCLGGGRTREQNCASSRQQVELMQSLMIAGYAAGAVLAVSAVVAFAVAPSRRAVQVGLHPGGISLSGRF
ncbi:MAG: PEGA domain-containing protein [Polyangiales bacterium]